MLYHVRHQLVDDQRQGDGHVRRHIHRLDVGRDAIVGTSISSADFATQIAEEGVETHDAGILTRVKTLVHGSNCEDPGGCAAQGIGGFRALRMRYL